MAKGLVGTVVKGGTKITQVQRAKVSPNRGSVAAVAVNDLLE
jgi:hypothetical protein